MGINLNIIVNIALIVVTIATGLIMHKSGKPYNFLTSIHKLTTIGFVIFLSFIFVYYINTHELHNYFLIILSLAILSIISLFVSGTFLSLDKITSTMSGLHKISALIFLVLVSFLLYFIVN